MCPTAPTAKYFAFTEDSNVPEELRTLADLQLKQGQLQDAVIKLPVTAKPLSTGNLNFTYSIYSLQNKVLRKKPGSGQDNPDAVTDLPGVLVQDSTGFIDPKPDPARDMTCKGFQATYDFYKNAFGRNSIDGNGGEIRASIHLARGLDNAFWDRKLAQMIFGDGGRWDGRGWLVPTEEELERRSKEDDKVGAWSLSNWLDNYDLDTIGHELTHGVVSYTAKLGAQQNSETEPAQWSEAATLNEHIADCFGVMLKHFVNKHTVDKANWDFSPNVWSPLAMKAQGWTENYCRTFNIPKDKSKSPDDGPKHANDILSWIDPDDGKGRDPHLNCGIPSRAFYNGAQGFKNKSPTSWTTVGKVWYNALTDADFAKKENQTFQGWKGLTIKNAERLFGADGKTIMFKAWADVGLK